MIFSGSRVAGSARAAVIRGFIHENDSVRYQPFKSQRAVVGERANDFLVVVPVVWKAVALDYRPVGEIGVKKIRRIRDPVFFLVTCPAAERHISAAQSGMSPYVPVCFDNDYRCPGFSSLNGGGKSRRAGTDNHNVRLVVPTRGFRLSACFFRAEATKGNRAGTGDCGFEKISP